MANNSPFSTSMDAKIKNALQKFCKQKGLKISAFIEEAVLEKLEDEYDLEIYHKRKNEPRLSMDAVFKSLR